jgi:hypothetical protein
MAAALRAAAVRQNGYTVVDGVLDTGMLRSVNGIFRNRASLVQEALGDKPIGIGSAAGYDEATPLRAAAIIVTCEDGKVVQRSPGRFDMPTQATCNREMQLPTHGDCHLHPSSSPRTLS